MTEERKLLLNSIGFGWGLSKKRKREGMVKMKKTTNDIEGTTPTSVPDATERPGKRRRVRPTPQNIRNELARKGLDSCTADDEKKMIATPSFKTIEMSSPEVNQIFEELKKAAGNNTDGHGKVVQRDGIIGNFGERSNAYKYSSGLKLDFSLPILNHGSTAKEIKPRYEWSFTLGPAVTITTKPSDANPEGVLVGHTHSDRTLKEWEEVDVVFAEKLRTLLNTFLNDKILNSSLTKIRAIQYDADVAAQCGRLDKKAGRLDLKGSHHDAKSTTFTLVIKFGPGGESGSRLTYK